VEFPGPNLGPQIGYTDFFLCLPHSLRVNTVTAPHIWPRPASFAFYLTMPLVIRTERRWMVGYWWIVNERRCRMNRPRTCRGTDLKNENQKQSPISNK
jgi:hypothetical protein